MKYPYDANKLQSYWKTWGRAVYSDTLIGWFQSMFRCHIWLKIYPPNLPNLPR